ncbi:MAG TPA: inorganic diphosphatase [Brumimicrobium sp.]|nr:inorganic diphosphatase [Brumimicrobium sp.]
MKTFDAFIEIPSGSRNKYEYDFKLKRMRFDRLLYANMKYPAEYGFIPETCALDGDPLDVLVLASEPYLPGILVEVKAIGVFYMVDGGDNDEKIICVPVDDPRMRELENIDDVNKHFKKEVEEFFKTYKNLENKIVEVNGFGDKDAAYQLIEECKTRYEAVEENKKPMFKL